jgi:hypothetical protein
MLDELCDHKNECIQAAANDVALMYAEYMSSEGYGSESSAPVVTVSPSEPNPFIDTSNNDERPHVYKI